MVFDIQMSKCQTAQGLVYVLEGRDNSGFRRVHTPPEPDLFDLYLKLIRKQSLSVQTLPESDLFDLYLNLNRKPSLSVQTRPKPDLLSFATI